MSDLSATTSVRYEFSGRLESADGFAVEFVMDDSLRSWWQIVRWNWHCGHWGALRVNARDLFTKVLRRKLWRR